MMEDLINSKLPDDQLIEIFRRIDSNSDRDSCCLVCIRWFHLERLSRKTIQFGRSGRNESTNHMVRLFSRRFVNVENVFINELSVWTSTRLGKRRPVHRRSASAASFPHGSDENMSDEYVIKDYCLSDSGLAAVGAGFAKLEKLSLIWCSCVTDVGLRSFAERCKSLKSLDLQGCFFGDEGLAAVGESCNRLEDLNMRFCEGLTDMGLVQLAHGRRQTLKSLGVGACANISDVSLEAVGSHCKSLDTLSLDSDVINNKGLVSVAKGCPLLKVLKLQCVNITDEALQAVGRFCLSLELLSLHSFQKFSDRGMYAIGKGCKRLKNLMLSDCDFLSNKCLDYVAVGCPELMHIEINGCHNIGTAGLKSIGKSCTRLSELALLYCQRLDNDALSGIGEGCRFLQALELVDCSGIGDDSICSIAKGCRNLRKLHIRRCYDVFFFPSAFPAHNFFSSFSCLYCEISLPEFCQLVMKCTLHYSKFSQKIFYLVAHYNFHFHHYQVGDRGIMAIGQNCKFLTDLSLRFCDRIGNDALISVSEGCSLHHLNVSGCHRIGDAGIIAIARGCPQLSSLDVSVLQNLGDRAMMELGEGCPLLKNVVISHCRKITDVGFGYVVRKCPLLESFHVVYCPGITAAGVTTMVTSCMRMKKILVERWKVCARIERRGASIINYLCIEL
ncbi:hypothetical protein RD792_010079 [Penstemon davidsonii]|uniref:F-box/LRR-repeat protein 4 n=1 Tax=Penstemon davidsonii TaxID=160366 RepID=A0ABR0D279_9LAMI|nr:hypothetical protein RD792_010079 [Penstemon davidsonii]